MIDYLTDLLDESAGNLSVGIWDQDTGKWNTTVLRAIDQVGIVTWSSAQTTFMPWASVTTIRVIPAS